MTVSNPSLVPFKTFSAPINATFIFKHSYWPIESFPPIRELPGADAINKLFIS